MNDNEKKIEAYERVTDHFLFSECTCPCCERVKIIPGFFRHMKLLERMRQELGFPIIINSGYRCPEHNREVNGSLHSWHMNFATDVRPAWVQDIDDEEFLRRLVSMHESALKLNFGGIGEYNSFLHLDLRQEKTRWKG